MFYRLMAGGMVATGAGVFCVTGLPMGQAKNSFEIAAPSSRVYSAVATGRGASNAVFNFDGGELAESETWDPGRSVTFRLARNGQPILDTKVTLAAGSSPGRTTLTMTDQLQSPSVQQDDKRRAVLLGALLRNLIGRRLETVDPAGAQAVEMSAGGMGLPAMLAALATSPRTAVDSPMGSATDTLGHHNGARFEPGKPMMEPTPEQPTTSQPM